VTALKPLLTVVILSVAIVAVPAAGALGGEAPKEPDPTWPWPGPTPPEIREALIEKHTTGAFLSTFRLTEPELKKIEGLAPNKAPTVPLRPRTVLVWGHLWAYPTNCFTEATVRILGKKTGAFQTVASDDPQSLLPERLKDFDAIVFLGSYKGKLFLPPWDIKDMPADQQTAARELDRKVKQSVLAFAAEEGKGVVGIESSLNAFQDWKDYGELMGATRGGEYAGNFVIKVEDPSHPLTAPFAGQTFRVFDQSYPPGPPYSRKKVRVLLSLDMAQTPDPAAGPKMAWLKKAMEWQSKHTGREADYALSWIKSFGKGRTICISLGVHKPPYFHPLFLRYLLGGIQFATGDLAADTTPSER